MSNARKRDAIETGTASIATGRTRRRRDVCPEAQRKRTTAGGQAASAEWIVQQGDCLALMQEMKAGTADAVITDPPYGINFQGRRWDGQAIRESAATSSRRRLGASEAFEEWTRCWAKECLRVLKPGGHLLAFGSPRTFHRLACGLEDAGLQLRDTLMWLYGSGMPKSRRLPGGRGTTLKPAWEPILLCRRPPEGTIERNLRRYGTGALNVDGCRVDQRWPANVLLGHNERCTLDACAAGCALLVVDQADERDRIAQTTRTPPSRLFFCSKVARSERDAGCAQLPARDLNLFPNAHRRGLAPPAARNPHPTVKPIALMRWLVRLACPPGGLVLDPFCGSGSTGAAALCEQRRFLGIERESAYVQIARARIVHWALTAGECPKERTRRPLARKDRRAR